MAKRKKNKGKGPAKLASKSKSTPRYAQPGRPAVDFNAVQTHAAVASRFSLRDEAQWASNHRTAAFDSGKKLRHMPIAFVSAGLLQGTLEDKPAAPAAPAEPAMPPSPSLDANDLAQMTIRSPSPSPSAVSVSSDSSEEVVVFRGRGQPPLARASIEKRVEKSPVKQVANSSEVATTAAETSAAPQAESDVDSETNSVIDAAFCKRRGDRPVWMGTEVDWVSRSKNGIGWLPAQARPNMDAFLRGEVDPRAEAMDDYAQNIEEHGLADEIVASASFANREMDLEGGSHNDWSSHAVNLTGVLEEEDVGLNGWDSDDLRDLDGNSTSTDVEHVVARVIGKRTRVTGLQYLVVYDGSPTDDARWLPATFLTNPSDLELIRRFEVRHLARNQPISSSSNSGSELNDDEDSDADEELDDEAIARVLQKQEELGLGSDDVVLYAADEHFGHPVSGRVSAASMSFGRPNHRRQFRAGGARRPEPTFPSAGAMADALDMDPYGAFDIMDTERPSLRPRKKGRRGAPPPEVEDPDLNEQIQSTWAADRAKKRLKKAEREELRRQGLLGRKGKAPDLSVKYKDGINIADIREDIRDFMASNMSTLSLPPMDKHQRAVIHQFVRYLGINSTSRGNGVHRFTILSRDKRTPLFDDDLFDAIFEGKKFLNRWGGGARGRMDRRSNGPAGTAPLRQKVGYKDGEVVGASAPELGPENKGRALMEKMGWSKGMALGATDNKGILQPIAHVVKTNKAGLQ
ncbi:hypothetical protein P280DRAFT_468978 [Massarina eburnea CBS 473.64]|uniref:Protein SQS1 n=1 Tax=Massarina eburnea CBS 473.64 TaxID=1395130 RepID=A0A6A6S0J1_9PLEO|nr:hypothetical protein P280DRAFT_468978 [Massarina eburnea CBS 473.64]